MSVDEEANRSNNHMINNQLAEEDKAPDTWSDWEWLAEDGGFDLV